MTVKAHEYGQILSCCWLACAGWDWAQDLDALAFSLTFSNGRSSVRETQEEELNDQSA
jgi:hypothetical protein